MTRAEKSTEAIRARFRRLERVHLTESERAQVERIIAERRVKNHKINLREAIEVVMLDRSVREMVCHGGTEETI